MRPFALCLALLWLASPAACVAPEGEGPAKGAATEPAEALDKAPDQEAPAAKALPSPKRDVVLWHAYRGQEKAALEEAVKGFQAAQARITVRVQAVPYDPYLDKIAITIPRGQGPDVFIFAHNMVGAWVEEGLLEPLSKRVPPALLDTLLPQSVKALVYQQNLYGLPLAFKSLALFYNTAKLPKAPETMEALIAAVTPLQNKAKGIHGLVYEAGLLYHHAPWMHAFGGSVFDAEGRPSLDTPEQAAALSYARSLHTTHGVVPKGMSSFMLTSLFNDGKAIAVLNGPWFRAEISLKDYGVAPIPTVDGKTPKPFLGIEAAFVSAKSELKDAAAELAVYLAGPDGARPRAEIGKQPVCHVATLDAASQADPVLGVFKAQAERSVLMPSQPELQLVWSTADSAINGAVFAGKPIEEVLKRAQDKVKADVARRGQ
jgi:arabinogalactan oligomer / maltooligosaccharide transport system substrate-binding protein